MLHRVFQFTAAALLLGATVFSTTADARQTLTLNYREQEMRGNTVIQLKRDLQQAYPQIRVQDLDLVSVTVELKTPNSGDASLLVGRYSSGRYGVYGTPLDYVSRDPRTYQQVNLFASSGDSFADWQVLLSGQFKVRRILVDVEYAYRPPPPPPPPRGRYVEIVCESANYNPAFCRVGFAARRVTLIQQYSTGRGACIEGRTFYPSGDGVQVTNGCRGKFGVYEY